MQKRQYCYKAGMKTRAFLEVSILIMLAESSSYGYSLMDSITEFNIPKSIGAQGVIYRVLRGLEAEGLVSSKWDIQSEGPPRRVYSITKKGKEYLRTWKEQADKIIKQLKFFIDKIKEID